MRWRLRSKGTPVFKLKVSVNSDVFEVEGDIPVADALATLHDWFNVLNITVQSRVDQLAGRLKTANDDLANEVTTHHRP